MKFPLLSLLAVLGCQHHLASAAGLEQPLQYNLDMEQTNGYRVEIDVQSDAGPESVTGTFLVSAKPSGKDFVTLAATGQFRPKPVAGRPPMMYRPGFVPLISSLGQMYGPAQSREVTIDKAGKVARVSGDPALPIPLGTLFSALFPELPPDTSGKWEASRTMFVMDEPVLQGPALVFSTSPYGSFGGYGYSPGRAAIGPLAATIKTKSEVKEATPETVSIQTGLALDTLLSTGDEPRISSSAEGSRTFDVKTGLLKSAEWSAKSVLITEHLSRRTTLKLKISKIEGGELAEALKPPPPPKSPEESKISSAAAAELISKMRSSDTGARMSAANELSSKTVEGLDGESRDKLVSLAGDKEDYIRRAALKTLAVQPRASDLQVLARGVSEEDSSLRQTLIKAIGSFKSTRAATVLADIIAAGPSDSMSGMRSSEAAEALIMMGSLAEAPMLPLLKEKNTRTLVDACNVLRETGSSRSMAPLKELVAHPSKNVSEAAAGAIRAIQAREGNESSRSR